MLVRLVFGFGFGFGCCDWLLGWFVGLRRYFVVDYLWFWLLFVWVSLLLYCFCYSVWVGLGSLVGIDFGLCAGFGGFALLLMGWLLLFEGFVVTDYLRWWALLGLVCLALLFIVVFWRGFVVPAGFAVL